MTEEIKEIFYKLKSDDYYEEHYQQSVYYEKDLKKLENYITNLQKENEDLLYEINGYLEEKERLKKKITFNEKSRRKMQQSLMEQIETYKLRNEKAVENAKEKIKKYESYIHDLKNGNYPSSTVRLERQELIFRIREQEDLINILEGGDEEWKI